MSGGRGVAWMVVSAALAGFVLTGCAADPGPAPADLYGIATFEVAGQADETFRVGLASEQLLDHALLLLEGGDVSAIPLGTVVRDGDGGVNAPWSWHLDPSTFEFADFTTEVCDGLPSYVEREEVTSPYYCPWIAKITDVEVLR